MGVTGIGGFFFRAQDPKALAAWYSAHLDVGDGEWGMWHPAGGQSVFAPFDSGTDYFPSAKQWMINFRVEGLDELTATLAAKGIEIVTNPEWDAAGVGRFARIHDPEGNAIELWEPA